MSLIKNDGLCFTQFSPYDDPQHQRHYPIKPMSKPGMITGGPVDLIQFVGRDGVVYCVNPCRVCGALIAYAQGTHKDEE